MRRVTFRGLAARKLRLSLTALAIVLGVTFVTGTLVLGDTLNRTFDDLVGTAYQHVSFEIRGKATLNGTDNTPDSTADRRPVPESIAAVVARVPGVAYVHGSAGGYAQFLARNGDAIGGGGGSTLGFSFDPNRQLSPYRLVQGRAPTTSDDVVMDKATATKYHFAVGDRVLMNLPDRAQRFTVTGLVTYGSDDNLAGVTLAGFDLATAQRLFHLSGAFDTISVLAAPGADTGRLQRAIAEVLPAGVEVVSGQTVASELSSAVNDALSFISTALLIFSAIALFVGAFTIFNTLSITVGQRTRELALLRVVGAGRRQVFASVLGEAALTGLIASLAGLGMGVAAALGLRALLGAFGITLPSAPLVFEARTPVVAIAVGVGVTVLSAIVPARGAVRIAPVAALSELGAAAPEALRRRRIAGGALAALAGAGLIAAGVAGATVALVGLGALAIFGAATLLVPLAARPLSGTLGRPLAAAFGIPGRLGRENSMRNPRRTAQTAAALMIGLALVSSIAVLGASLSTSATHEVDSAVNADYLVTGSDGFSRSVIPAVAHLPGVTTTTAVYRGQFEFRGALSSLAAVTPTRLAQTVNLHLVAGRGAAAMAGAHHLAVGATVPVRFAQTGATTLRIGGIFASNPLVGSFIVGARVFASHFPDPQPTAVLLRTAPGTPSLGGRLSRVLAPYANVSAKTRAQFEADQKHSVDQELGLVYVLLALAIVVALIGIVNTLMLSVFERTHEIGLMRAVGAKRRQVRSMIRAESVIVALFGAVVGVAIGTGLGVAAASSLRDNGVASLSVPVASMVGFLVLAALLGLAAASWPARRAARLDVLAAIAVE